jgi:nucleotide-binding universal stress UspA family protein
MDTEVTLVDRILVPLDGSPLAERAIPFVQCLARPGAEVILLRVVPAAEAIRDVLGQVVVPTDESRRRFREFARRDLYRAAQLLRSDCSGARVQVVVADGDPAEEIARAARDLGVGLIVMTSEGHGATDRLTYGSVADRVVRSSPIPVVIVRARGSRAEASPAPLRRIVVPLDGSDRAAQALPVAEGLARLLGVPVALVTAIDMMDHGAPAFTYGAAVDRGLYDELFASLQLEAQQALDRAGAHLIVRGVPAHWDLLAGSAAGAIAEATCPGDLIVMTSRGGGTKRWPIGSVAQKVVRDGPATVLLLPTKAEPEVIAPVVDDTLARAPARSTRDAAAAWATPCLEAPRFGAVLGGA